MPSRPRRPLPWSLACLAVAALLVAGCLGGTGAGQASTGRPDGSSSPGTGAPGSPSGASPAATDVGVPDACTVPAGDPSPEAFNGTRAWLSACSLLYDAHGVPLVRYPGTKGHDALAQALLARLKLPGWTAQAQPFQGSLAFFGMPEELKGYTRPPTCSESRHAQVERLGFTNLLAYRTAVPASDKSLVLMAHWDQKRNATEDVDPTRRTLPVPGANDGASGVGILLELVHHVSAANLSLPFNLFVVLVDGEDGFEDCHPLAGSSVFANEGEWDTSPRVLLLDMVGDPQARFIRESRATACDPALADLLWSKAPQHGMGANFVPGEKPVFDDHIPFLDKGMPASDLIDFARDTPYGFPPYWHTRADTMDKITPGALGRLGALLLDALQDPALLVGWPTSCPKS